MAAMTAQIRNDSPSAPLLADYARVPIAFKVRERFVVLAPEAGPGGLRLVAEPVAAPYVKDCDAELGQHPTTWPACRFYARQGCTLGALHRYAYPTLPDEAQLLWYKPLRPDPGATAIPDL